MQSVELLYSQKTNEDVVLNKNVSNLPAVNEPVLRRSTRLRKPPSRLDWYPK